MTLLGNFADDIFRGENHRYLDVVITLFFALVKYHF